MRKDIFLNTTVVAIIALGLVLLGVYVLSRDYLFQSYWLGNKGSLGDAVNGLSAPIISFISAILIYITFQEQVKANKLIQSQWTFDTYQKIFTEVKDSYEAISVKFFPIAGMTPQVYMGEKAYETICTRDKNLMEGRREALQYLEMIVEEMIFLIDNVNQSTFSQRVYLSYKIIRYFQIYMQDVFEKLKTKHLVETERRQKDYSSLIVALGVIQKKIEILQQQEFKSYARNRDQ